MATTGERSLFDLPVGDFDWGPRRRWRSAFSTLTPAVLIVLGAVLLIVGISLL